MTGPPGAAAFPGWWRAAVWTFGEVCIVIDAPYDTIYRWKQLAAAAGIDLGHKPSREWKFSAHDLYVFRILAAFSRAHLPVGPTQIRAVLGFAFDGAGRPILPTGKLIQEARDAEFAVDAERIFRAVAHATDPAHPENRGRYA